jgi:crotonobetainyl-CoA:carnitine CoA-transferase CaiB-like acyl-CoA transferase
MEGRETSLYFWNYNRGKRSVAWQLTDPDDWAQFKALVSAADVLLYSAPLASAELAQRFESLALRRPLIIARMTPFGDSGPWAGYKGSDLVHLALGGVMMNCGYDPEPDGQYDLPPVAPQAWHAYHIAGEQLAFSIVAALLYRQRTGSGQSVSCAVHQAVAGNTELDTMLWTMLRAPVYRRTCRHATPLMDGRPMIGLTKDGRWVLPFVMAGRTSAERTAEFLTPFGVGDDVEAEQESGAAEESSGAAIPGSGGMTDGVVRLVEHAHRVFARFTYDRVPWRQAQDVGLLWAPLRKPHENVEDPHWQARGTFESVEHPEVGASYWYPVSKWVATKTAWQKGRRAPKLDEDGSVYRGGAWATSRTASPDTGIIRKAGRASSTDAERLSRLGKPFALHGVRILDFTWYLAPAGATRFLAAFGAECIKVEWKGNPDSRRGAMAPVGGREARQLADRPLDGVTDPDMGGQFNNKNPGKLGLSLNVRHPTGAAIARRLVGMSDIVAEGFSPGVMDRWGLGYETLREIRPDVIYAQQSGFGTAGLYGRYRAVGPIAAALTGMSEMSGLPEPSMPAGWGYSYLDWIAAYSFAMAMLSALYHREATGEGQWIDASQCETGLYLGGSAILDWSANGRAWQRIGNRSPFKRAAPHGVYRTLGDDRWLAIACFTDPEWQCLVGVMDAPGWACDERFATLDGRYALQDDLDRLLTNWTCEREGFELMDRLQAAGVPAGVCQTAEDKCDRDPQLRALDWLTEVSGAKIGTWPVVGVPVQMTESPPFVGGPLDRGAPIYGQDNEYILGELLGMSTATIQSLASEGVI